jgi:RNA polymerase sigma factor (sigma-70 family)
VSALTSNSGAGAKSSFEHLLRELAPQVLGVLVRRFRDFAAAEDALQEAMLAAAQQWPGTRTPESPRAWLTEVAARRLTDEIRASSARRRREEQQGLRTGYVMPACEDTAEQEDDTLILLFMCCHPALTDASAIALTLRAVGGLTTCEISSAFLVPESTMAQRISRAKQSIRSSGIPFSMPPPGQEDANLRNLMHVLYLIFNEGYSASSGDQLVRVDLSEEAIRLTRLLLARMRARRDSRTNPELLGLLALMLLTDARRLARTDSTGAAIPLDKQDRSLWKRDLIEEGTALVTLAFEQGAAGPYQMQAAIAALHDEAPSFPQTDWPQILALYEVLLRMGDNPMVRLNHAVAFTMAHGVAAGLARFAELGEDRVLRTHHRYYAARAHVHEMAGETLAAEADYQEAARLTGSRPERDYLLQQAARVRDLQQAPQQAHDPR